MDNARCDRLVNLRDFCCVQKKIIACLVVVSVFELETISVSELLLRPVNLKLTLDSFFGSFFMRGCRSCWRGRVRVGTCAG